MPWTRRPEATEYASFYAGYVASVPAGDLLEILRAQAAEVAARMAAAPPGWGDHRYAPGKWSVKQVLGHMIDCERVFAYRTLAFGRGDQTPLPGFDQDVWMAGCDFDARSLASLAAEFATVRAATLSLLEAFDASTLDRGGEASDNPITVRALCTIIAGHAAHHLRVLDERYGG